MHNEMLKKGQDMNKQQCQIKYAPDMHVYAGRLVYDSNISCT